MGLGAGFKLKDLKDKEREKENIKEKDKGERHKLKKEREKDDEDPSSNDAYAPSGWTSILEDWLCNGVGLTTNKTASSLSSPGTPPAKHQSPGGQQRSSAKEQWKGPYQPLIKERMMGLYLTVFVHRDIRNLVRGKSMPPVLGYYIRLNQSIQKEPQNLLSRRV